MRTDFLSGKNIFYSLQFLSQKRGKQPALYGRKANKIDEWYSLSFQDIFTNAQKLSGQAANGDIASTNYSRDYNATTVGSEKINGEQAAILLLKAKTNQVTYDQIKYWISTKNKLALRAEFMTLQGKAFKIATFEYKNTLTSDGKAFPFISKMTIQDAKFPNNNSVIQYSKPKAENLSDSIFNINNLSR